MLPWMREFEIRVLLEEMDDEDDERWRLLVVVFLSYMSLKLREVYLLVFAIHCEGMKMGRRWFCGFIVVAMTVKNAYCRWMHAVTDGVGCLLTYDYGLSFLSRGSFPSRERRSNTLDICWSSNI
ncbi:hypothetical protein HanXRQr2_Chr16g0770831 [Helianthus annuus]|uniref:Uncharacterized protein n=1 Tax=Helianthus annuus TaxID=4232 RepID=A0A9K3H0I7_HELAN|nr:hypothetical protein HanXRQr2_Chr16g0770831 [Helianthus annuus]KAJ0823034.1 hypothetical protein HanPSC8_Chr16g0738941 [Helianthus annuus]